MRPWMEYLHASLEFYLRDKNKNIIMFLIRLVYNCENIFMPYASNWIDLIVKCLIFLDDVNYFTSDIVSYFDYLVRIIFDTFMTFLWHTPPPPSPKKVTELCDENPNEI